MIKTIFFDIGGVLIDISFRRASKFISDCIDVPVSKVEEAFPSSIHDRYEKGLISNHDWFTKYKESLPQPCFLKEVDFWKAWSLLLGKETKVVSLIEKLKTKYSIWLLSNTNPKHINDEIEKNYRFPKLIDGAIYSFNVGFRKPEKEIYIKAAKVAKSKPDECFFIDDLRDNIQVAKEVGFHGVHFKSYEKLVTYLKKEGVF